LEARVSLYAGKETADLLRKYRADLRYIFIVSQVDLTEHPDADAQSLRVEVSRAQGEKCERCWNYSVDVGKSPRWPTLCERCQPVVEEFLN